MRDREKKRHYAYEALQILLLLALLLFITRLWPILLLVILGIFVAALRLLFLSSKKIEPVEPVLALPEPVSVREPTDQDMKSLAFQLIHRRITQILQQKYPDVRWIWENPYAKEDIFAGNKVYVILNRAGGYRRGLVLIRNLQVFDVVFEPVREEESPQKPEPANPGPIIPPGPNTMLNEDQDEDEEDIPEDYGLIAFSWVEANVLSLNDRINEAIAKREEEILIPAEELPVKESWDEICKELTRNDVTGASCKENGILIEFEQ